ncbi:MAG: response regulator [Deltaproteobacteria bacterium]|nr:response regulator [Deltaproteobacteria bacterium]
MADNLAQLKVLLVDDSATARQYLHHMMESLGHLPLSASSGPEALGILERQAREVDLILCDLVMPGMDGLTLLAKVREQLPDTPFIIVTSHSTLDSAIGALRSGADDYLPKPFDREMVARRIAAVRAEHLLKRSRQEQARLEAAMATAGATAHEINQPLTAILAAAQLLERHHLPSEQQKLTSLIAQESLRLGGIVHRLVNITEFKTRDYLRNTKILDLEASTRRN